MNKVLLGRQKYQSCRSLFPIASYEVHLKNKMITWNQDFVKLWEQNFSRVSYAKVAKAFALQSHKVA